MVFTSKGKNYELVPQQDQYDELCIHLMEKGKEDKPAMASRRSSLLWLLSLGILCLVMLCFNVVLATLLLSRASISQFVKELSYCPATFNKVTRQFNGSLFPPKNPSWSRLAPGAETDEIWMWYEPSRHIPLSEADIISMGKDPATTVKLSSGPGIPADSYLGSLDIFHKIHCLNELRKMTFEGYTEDGSPAIIKPRHPLQWIHLRHCVDMMAQDLQCNANLDIVTYSWVDGQYYPFPDHSIARTCTDWDQFLDWINKNSIDQQYFMNTSRPADTQLVPAEDGYYEMFGFENSILFPMGKGYKARQ